MLMPVPTGSRKQAKMGKVVPLRFESVLSSGSYAPESASDRVPTGKRLPALPANTAVYPSGIPHVVDVSVASGESGWMCKADDHRRLRARPGSLLTRAVRITTILAAHRRCAPMLSTPGLARFCARTRFCEPDRAHGPSAMNAFDGAHSYQLVDSHVERPSAPATVDDYGPRAHVRVHSGFATILPGRIRPPNEWLRTLPSRPPVDEC